MEIIDSRNNITILNGEILGIKESTAKVGEIPKIKTGNWIVKLDSGYFVYISPDEMKLLHNCFNK